MLLGSLKGLSFGGVDILPLLWPTFANMLSQLKGQWRLLSGRTQEPAPGPWLQRHVAVPEHVFSLVS